MIKFSFVGCFVFTTYGNIRWPFIATLISNIFLYMIAYFLPVTQKENKKNISTFSIIKGFINDIYSNKQLRIMCLLNVFCSMILVSGYQLLQAYFY